jgi:hypothetical protein
MTKKPMSLQRASYIVAAFSLLGFSFHCGFAAQSDFVRFSKPELLTFDQLVDLEKPRWEVARVFGSRSP